MKAKEAQKIDETAKKYNNLVVKTNHQNTFDSRWAQIKIEGKNIPSRSNHIAAFFDTKYYIHGGYDADKGVLSDFNVIDLAEDSQVFQWKKLNNQIQGKPIRLKGHSAVVYKTSLILFGGQLHTNQSSNGVFVYDFLDNSWKKPQISGVQVPRVDSHAVTISGSKMYVLGGYIPEKAEYMKNLYCLDLEKYSWELIHEGKKSANEPEPRSNFSMVADNDSLFIFGGTNGQSTLNDFWKFSLTQKKWEIIKTENPPQRRRGHSMIMFENNVFLFGGIQDITKEKNDIYIYQSKNNSWNKIHTSTNSIYECSPTLKNEKKKNSTRSPDKIQLHKVSPQKNSEKGSDIMKKILNENKQKRFMEKKKELLKQFSEKPNEFSNVRSHSPTTQSMLKTLQSIGNQEVSRKELKQQIIYDQSHRYIIGKKPCARDGQSVCIREDKMYIFGGDRHLMAFNDLYSFDLEKGLKSLDLYRS